jgi:hypothetical protein
MAPTDDWFNKIFMDALQGVAKVKNWLDWLLQDVVYARVMDVIVSELGSAAYDKVKDGVLAAIRTAPDPYCGRERCSAICKATSKRCPRKATFGSMCFGHHQRANRKSVMSPRKASAIRNSIVLRTRRLIEQRKSSQPVRMSTA